MYIYSNRKIQQIPAIEAFLADARYPQCLATVGWGRKPSYFKAAKIAQDKNIPALCVEDGFIRSMGLGKQGCPPLSLVVDHSGIYFDALQSSDLEQLIAAPESTAFNQRATTCMALIRQYRITKYNQAYVALDSAQFSAEKNILIVDQTYGDQSIQYAGATASSFSQMLRQASLDHPDATLWLKVHPDVIANKAKGHFSAQDLQQPNLRLITESYHPIELLQHMDEVYVVSSQMGFEALLYAKKVHCFGMPWYAGWGLTHDQHAPIAILQGRRQLNRSIQHLFSCAYLRYARYISPLTAQRCELEQLLAQLIPNLQFQRQLSGSAVLYGFSPWKKKFLDAYLDFPQFDYRYQRYLKPAKKNHVVAWGRKAHLLRQQGYTDLTVVEDGFIRSIGLGASLIRPCSLVFDDMGIYYDATRASRLEWLLNHCQLSLDQQRQTTQLIEKIIAMNISKYNVGQRQSLDLSAYAQTKILVIGQVEDDMSVQLGGIDIKTNLALLVEVRRQNPHAYIIYKPHPDVTAGLRKGVIAESEMLQYADHIEATRSIVECFSAIDELHTLTSLSGFEALIRGIKVVCYGMPFYAGWGLTTDRHVQARRIRKLSLHELVYSVLVRYPIYNLPRSKHFGLPLTDVESVIDYIEQQVKVDLQPQQKKWRSIFLSFIRFKQRM
ncbi:capsular polysaccharide export protein [Acinetobacter calcoaceticus]|uniref:Capsular polysaccharide export protein n=1 Tax=Acinetobacter calcoaceticus TaxID=471 RepID=A0A4R1XV23_ACICA|nr:capsular polysaccharide export protein [Acinetobacter calcoaceticus]